MLTEKEVLNRALRALDELGATSITVSTVPNATLASNSQPEVSDLKGQAAELWRDGERFFIVPDEEGARLAMDRLGARRGEVWTRSEVERVARLEDQEARDLVQRFKREFDGRVAETSIEPRQKGLM